jgi:purine nucleoside phosphorylase
MGRLAVVGGHSIMDTGFPAGGERREIDVGGGSVAVHDAGSFVALQRHGLDGYTPPHAIDNVANVRALRELACDRVMAIGSVGGLRTELGVGTLLCPDDFIALHIGASSFDDARGHRVPGFDAGWRRRVVEAWAGAPGAPLRDGGTYWQTIGPRLETPAEIRLIAAHADVVGMTLAGECVIAGEQGLAYAAVCVVDNLANGVGDDSLSVEDIAAGTAANRERLVAALESVLPKLAKDAA